MRKEKKFKLKNHRFLSSNTILIIEIRKKKDIVLIYSEKYDNCKILDLSTWKFIFSKDIKTYWTIQSIAFTSKIDNFYLYKVASRILYPFLYIII